MERPFLPEKGTPWGGGDKEGISPGRSCSDRGRGGHPQHQCCYYQDEVVLESSPVERLGKLNGGVI